MSWLFIDKEHQRQRDEAMTQWRSLLRREVPMLRAIDPIPFLSLLSPFEQAKVHAIARDAADLARPREIKRRHRPTIFVARLPELAATELLFPEGMPDDFYPLVKEELREFYRRTPVASHAARGPFTFGATFTRLEAPSDKFKAVPPRKQIALLRWAHSKKTVVLLYTFHHQGGPQATYGRTDAYYWDGTELRLIEKKVGFWSA